MNLAHSVWAQPSGLGRYYVHCLSLLHLQNDHKDDPGPQVEGLVAAGCSEVIQYQWSIALTYQQY